MQDGALVWRDGAAKSLAPDILRPADDPFDAEGGIRMLKGPLGRAVIKVSAVKPEHQVVEAPALCFDDQDELLAAFQRGELDRDFVAVVRFQGPRANGMPELHSLTPTLSVLQDRGRKVALVTDGRMSGASGKVPAAIHLTPEAAAGGPLAKVRDGDVIRLDARAGSLDHPGRRARADGPRRPPSAPPPAPATAASYSAGPAPASAPPTKAPARCSLTDRPAPRPLEGRGWGWGAVAGKTAVSTAHSARGQSRQVPHPQPLPLEGEGARFGDSAEP